MSQRLARTTTRPVRRSGPPGHQTGMSDVTGLEQRLSLKSQIPRRSANSAFWGESRDCSCTARAPFTDRGILTCARHTRISIRVLGFTPWSFPQKNDDHQLGQVLDADDCVQHKGDKKGGD
eukprot:6489928-Amphidinium_carterae.1